MNDELGKAIAVLGPEVVQALLANKPDDQWELDFIKELISIFENSSPDDWGSWVPFLMVNDLLNDKVVLIEIIDWQFARVGKVAKDTIVYTKFQRMDRPLEPVDQGGFHMFGMSTVVSLRNLRDMARGDRRTIEQVKEDTETLSELLADSQ